MHSYKIKAVITSRSEKGVRKEVVVQREEDNSYLVVKIPSKTKMTKNSIVNAVSKRLGCKPEHIKIDKNLRLE